MHIRDLALCHKEPSFLTQDKHGDLVEAGGGLWAAHSPAQGAGGESREQGGGCSSGGETIYTPVSVVDFASSKEVHCCLITRIALVRCQQIISLSLEEDFAHFFKKGKG